MTVESSPEGPVGVSRFASRSCLSREGGATGEAARHRGTIRCVRDVPGIACLGSHVTMNRDGSDVCAGIGDRLRMSLQVRGNVTYVLRIGEVHSAMLEAEMGTSKSVFWDDLARDLEDPEFLREYVVESVRIFTIDQVVNALNDAREAAGLSKAALARAISAEPAAMRRLFSAGQVNPTLGTLAEVAAALGMRITIEPLPAADREQVTNSLLEGRSADTRTLVAHLAGMRTPLGREPALI